MVLNNKRIGGHVLADQLVVNGVDTIFCVPGESYLGLLDGLYNHKDKIKLITTRHESGASNMADAYAKITNKPGICLVSRGPGATNAANGIHTAHQDSTPLILFIGQVSRDEREREAQQEIDYKEMFKPMAKYVAEINDADRIPEFVNNLNFHDHTSLIFISHSGTIRAILSQILDLDPNKAIGIEISHLSITSIEVLKKDNVRNKGGKYRLLSVNNQFI